uniref:Aspartyl/asparaginy/proline hydroxylase domain-containing protein n=2 Tax=Alexandrium catenella TaxID=2925 RepID=A0A7S1W3B9_ALECA
MRALVGAELGEAAAGRLGRVEDLFGRMARREVHEEEGEHGRRYAPGFVEGLEPHAPFHDAGAPWCAELRGHWREIREELRRHLGDAGAWAPGAYAASNRAYAPDWKIAGVLTEGRWQSPERWGATQAVIERLEGVAPFEAFFARMPPHSKIAAHSDNLNYILTSHLALDLEAGMCSIVVGSSEREWEEGEVLVFDTTFLHSAYNDSGRDRYVLVLRFWHPGLAVEERRAIHLSHALLAATPDPDRAGGGGAEPSMSVTGD